MCLFSKPKAPEPMAPPPTPAPIPVITPSEVSPQAEAEGRRKRLDRLRFGLASTVKTGPRGISGAGADLQAPVTGKTRLGA